MRSRRAFTMIELIVVVMIIAVIASVIFFAVNPTKRLGDAQNAIRDHSALELKNGLERLIADMTSVPDIIGDLIVEEEYMLVNRDGDTAGTCACTTLDKNINRVDLAGLLSAYVPNLPIDEAASGDDTGYYIKKNAGNLFTVGHCYEFSDTVTTVSEPVASVAGPNSPQLAVNYGTGSYSWSYPIRVYANDTNYCTLGSLDDTPVEYEVKIVKADGSIGATNKASLATWRSTPEPDYMGDDWATVANPGYTTYGGESDLWGETWTAADINDSDFGVAIRLRKVSGGLLTTYLKITDFGFAIPEEGTITGIKMDMERWVYNPSNYEPFEYVDHARMTIYYEL